MKQTKSDKIRIAIADDHAIVRKGLIQIILENTDFELVGEAENGNDLLKIIRETPLDVVIMDIDMPGKSGWDVLNQLKIEYPKLPVIILSISPEEEYAVNFFKEGAAAYLHKTSAPGQLVDAIRKVAWGGKFVSPQLAEKLATYLERAADKPPHDQLSPREFQILCMIASGKTVKEIAEELSLGVPTISTHRARIMEKMHMRTNAQLTHYVFKNKLLA